ncbi:MAG: ATP-dependent DNA ligase [Theionarchaea archaeon]|nr:ATP-dependent DNA ligase [Theionarchaea archaeon]MBU6999417.1 ATP-dependent DNA ligase [Theionarchaea archaeon]MBU7022324.1 ATP-dependent DNA ligase [Theionarchaea archaeon]
MKFSTLIGVYESLEDTTKRLEMTDIVSRFLKESPAAVLDVVVYFLLGKVFPDWKETELGVGTKLVIRVVSTVSGVPEPEIEEYIREEGDIGKACERAINEKKQVILFSEELSVEYVYEILTKLSEFSGARSQERKIKYLSNLFSSATGKEARYMVRIVLGTMRTGIGEGTVRDAIAQGFGCDPSQVERAYMLTNDLGLVAKTARRNAADLDKLDITFFRPIKFMLAQVGTLQEAKERMHVLSCEIKYDGSRAQIHKKGKKIKIFSRRLEDITPALPDVVQAVRRSIQEDCIVEGEIVATENDHPRPFQFVLRRLRRKYDIQEMIKKIPLKVYIFDVLYKDGPLLDLPFRKRREILENLVKEGESARISTIMVTEQVKDAEEFFSRSLEMGHEGLMIKDLESVYQPGARGKKWLKIKETMETLDLAIIGADWGEGRRAHWLASFLLGIKDEQGDFMEIGKVGTGITDEMFKELTEKLTPYIVEQKGKTVKLIPYLVVEIAYEEIQKSPNYESGYALRFPRVVRLREDKSPEEADDINRLHEILGE